MGNAILVVRKVLVFCFAAQGEERVAGGGDIIGSGQQRMCETTANATYRRIQMSHVPKHMRISLYVHCFARRSRQGVGLGASSGRYRSIFKHNKWRRNSDIFIQVIERSARKKARHHDLHCSSAVPLALPLLKKKEALSGMTKYRTFFPKVREYPLEVCLSESQSSEGLENCDCTRGQITQSHLSPKFRSHLLKSAVAL